MEVTIPADQIMEVTIPAHSCFKWHMRSSVPIKLCFFFLSILKDQISLLNGALYGSPKVTLWTFAKNVMTGSQLTKNGFSPPKNDVFFKKFHRKTYISGNVRPSTEAAHSRASFRKD